MGCSYSLHKHRKVDYMYKLGKKSLKNLEGVNPILIEILNRALEISFKRKDGVDFTIISSAA